MIYALIPARGGSKRIPRKNLEKVGGLSLVARAIRAAGDSLLIDHIYVSTDDPEIATEARVYRARVIDRPAALSGDAIGMEAVVEQFREYVGASDADILVILEPTAPLRHGSDIDAAINLLRLSNADSVRLVSAVEDSGCHPVRYSDAGLANVVRAGALREFGCLFPAGTVLLHHGDNRSIDIDEPADLDRARAAADS